MSTMAQQKYWPRFSAPKPVGIRLFEKRRLLPRFFYQAVMAIATHFRPGSRARVALRGLVMKPVPERGGAR